MKCLRTLPHLKIYFIFAFLFFSFFLSAGISQNSYATSQHCSFTISHVSGDTNKEANILSACGFPTSVSSPVYYRFNSFTFNFTTSGSQRICVYLGNNVSTCGGGYAHYLYYLQPRNNLTASASNLNLIVSGFITNYDMASSSPTYLVGGNSTRYIGTYASSSFVYDLVIDLDYSDDLSDFVSGSSEPCPVCPVIPENPYDNKFDAITKAIYTCGAVLIMLYFFFCIYKIIVKDGGSR